MGDYTVIATFEYDNPASEGYWTDTAKGLEIFPTAEVPAPSFTYSDTDNVFNIGEDLTGGGNEYMGYIIIGSDVFPVVTGAGATRATPPC